MSSAFAWISGLIEWFAKWIPRLIIMPATHAGVKYVYGSRVKPMWPGLHVFWPLVTTTLSYPTVRQTLNPQPQTLVTKDGKSVVVDSIAIYRIFDIVAALGQSWNLEETISDVANASIVGVVTGRTYEELISGIATDVVEDLTEACATELRKFGVDIERVFLTDVSPCKVFKLVGSPG